MIYSDERKLALAGWLKENDYVSYEIPLKLQKFLFFYESASKVAGKDYDFYKLRGYKNGPVFSQGWGDYTKERSLFDIEADKVYTQNGVKIVDPSFATKIDFFIKTCTEDELSGITHSMNIWNSKKDRILSGEYQVDLEDKEFSAADAEIIKNIVSAYSADFIKNSRVLPIKNKIFLLSKKDAASLIPVQMDTLQELADEPELGNPIYIDIDETWRLLVD